MTTTARRARIYSGTPRNLATLARVLRRGGLVAAPTETVYGLAANALDAKACAGIFRVKGRPQTDPLIVHIASLAELGRLAVVNGAALVLAEKFWPGPLTIVLPKKELVPDIVSAGLPSVAVRMPAHPLFRKLLKLAGVPLAAPSANPFGYVSPTTAEHVQDNLGTKIGHILDGGACAVGVESTIVDLRDPRKPRLLRPGAVTQAQLEAALGVPVRARAKAKRKGGDEKQVAQIAPGLLTRHYSPRTPVVLHERLVDAAETVASAGAERAEKSEAPEVPVKTGTTSNRGEAWVFMAKPRHARGKNVFWFDAHGNLRGVARRLFAVLRKLDEAGFARIHVEQASGADGLVEAINDRLRRAAAKR
jgi:L-threonylcarbamoyladenylate synthase